MDKETLTPGRLYARLSQEFHRTRPEECRSCQMPMVTIAVPRTLDEPNWTVEPHKCCKECAPLIEDIVERYSRRYSMYDPVSALQGRPLPIGYPHAPQ